MFGLSGTCGILCTMTDIPALQKYSFMALMMPSIGANVISAAAVEAYPTSSRYLKGSPCYDFSSTMISVFFLHHRAMGLCVSLMFGRLGAVSGSYIVAILLNDYCESTFYLSGSSILGKVVRFPEFSVLLFNVFLNYIPTVACGFLAFFLPKAREASSKDATTIDRRISISSRV